VGLFYNALEPTQIGWYSDGEFPVLCCIGLMLMTQS